jgi:hypothetical protein
VSKALSEDSEGKRASANEFGTRQLFRRPAPTAAAGTPTEWIKAHTGTDLGTSYTILDWIEDGDSCYDTSIPTFAINASGDLEIGQDGMYDLMVYRDSAGASSPNQVEVHILRGYHTAGANPIVLGIGSFTSPREVRLLYRYDDTTVLDSGNLTGYPDWYTPLAYFDGDIASDGVTKIQFQSYVEINGTGTATTDINWALFCRRIGPACIPPPE